MSHKEPTRKDSYTEINEWREFSDFTAREQIYICRSLDLAFNKAVSTREIAGQYDVDSRVISQQKEHYRHLTEIKNRIPHDGDTTSLKGFFESLFITSTFDLLQDHLSTFSAYRFLYERLLGAEARPYLPSAFCAAAAMPVIPPTSRRSLLQSLSETAATAPGWSEREPTFMPSHIGLDLDLDLD